MRRLTISLSERTHRALKQASAERRQTIGELIEESLEFYGIRCAEDAAAIVARVRANAALSENEALQLAVDETRRERTR